MPLKTIHCHLGSSVGICLLVFSSIVAATPEEVSDGSLDLELVLHQSGVEQQLAAVSRIIGNETLALRSVCADAPEFSASFTNYLNNVFSTEQLNRRAVDLLDERLLVLHRHSVLEWYRSDAGQALARAEASMPDENSVEFNRLRVKVQDGNNWEQERRHLVRAVIQESKVAEFVAAYNSALNMVASLASSCTVDEYSDRKSRIDSVRNDQALLAMFMRESLVLPTAVAFHRLSDDTLAGYWKFSNSESGQALHKALIDVVWSSLIETSEVLDEFMFNSAIEQVSRED